MSFLRDKLDQLKKPFEKGGKLEKFHPAIQAFDTLLFVPKETTKTGAHVRDAVDLKRVMITVVLALIPALLFGIWNSGYQYLSQLNPGAEVGIMEAFWEGSKKVIPMIIVSYVVGLAIEFYFAIKRGHDVNEGYLVTGLLIPMIFPIDTPLWMVAVSVAFAVLIGKEAFGGTGMNILNPALTARAFAFFAYPTYMSGATIWVSHASEMDAISGETILGDLAQGNEVTTPIWDMFVGVIPGSIAETSTLLILLGGLLLLVTRVASWRIILSGLLGGAAMALIFNALPEGTGNALTQFEWYKHLLVGGFAFGLIFMATDPVTGAQTTKGKWIYGFLIGFLAIMIIVVNPAYPEGMMLAILLMNVFAPTIDYYVIQSNIKKRRKRLETQLKSA